MFLDVGLYRDILLLGFLEYEVYCETPLQHLNGVLDRPSINIHF